MALVPSSGGRDIYYAQRLGPRWIGPAFKAGKWIWDHKDPILNILSRRARKRQENKAPVKPRKKKTGFFESVSGKNGGNKRRLRPIGRRFKRRRQSVRKMVNRLKKVVNTNDSVFNSFTNDAATLVSGINNCAYSEFTICSPGSIETMLSKVPYTNPASAATKGEVNYTGLTIPNKWKLGVWCKWTFRNNFVKPVDICVYVVKPKNQTNQGPATAVTYGLTNMEGSSAITTTNCSFYPTHSKNFVDNWKIISSQKRSLEAGDEFTVTHAEKFTYDNEYTDTYTLSHQPKYSRFVLVRIQGKVGHDATTTSLVGITAAQIDCVNFCKISIKYPGNAAPIQSIAQVNNLDPVVDDIVATHSGQSNT